MELVLTYFNRKFLKRSLALGNRNYELAKTYIAGITDQINGIKDIKSNTLEESRMTWFQRCNSKNAKRTNRIYEIENYVAIIL